MGELNHTIVVGLGAACRFLPGPDSDISNEPTIKHLAEELIDGRHHGVLVLRHRANPDCSVKLLFNE